MVLNTAFTERNVVTLISPYPASKKTAVVAIEKTK